MSAIASSWVYCYTQPLLKPLGNGESKIFSVSHEEWTGGRLGVPYWIGKRYIWRNITTEEKSKVAETLQEFRGNYIYNLLDENVRRFNAEVPMLAQRDDHEVTNNWYPNEVLTNEDSDARYTVKSVALLTARATQAFLEYMPIHINNRDPERIYRSFSYGPALDIFMIDKRSYRGPNSANQQPERSDETAFLGNRQIAWLKRNLLNSKATWKVVASDMPIGVVVPEGATAFENGANGDGPALGRELEIADLLRFIKHNNIRNVVWITADVHYAAAHYYDPNQAQFQDFYPYLGVCFRTNQLWNVRTQPTRQYVWSTA